MKHKISELQGALLDAAVAKAEGFEDFWWNDGRQAFIYQAGPQHHLPLPSMAEWGSAGPLIERERIAPQPGRRGDIGNEWADQPEPALGWEVHLGGRTITGPTYLIAAMRAFCASRFGEFVELP